MLLRLSTPAKTDRFPLQTIDQKPIFTEEELGDFEQKLAEEKSAISRKAEELQMEKDLLQQKEEDIALQRQRLQQVHHPQIPNTPHLQAELHPPACFTLSGSRRSGET